MKKYYKLFIVLLFISFILPQIAFASWWNPLSWFAKTQVNETIQSNAVIPTNNLTNENNVNENNPQTETTPTSTTQTCSNQSKLIDQWNQTISLLTKQLKEYKCPTCEQNQTQCPICPKITALPSGAVLDDKGNIITPACQICSTCPACQTCPTCPTTQPTTLITPLSATCFVSPNPNYQGQSTNLTAQATGGNGTYLYSWTGNRLIRVNSCGTTTNPVCSTKSCYGIVEWCEHTSPFAAENIPWSNDGAHLGSVSLTVTSGSQSITIECPELILSR